MRLPAAPLPPPPRSPVPAADRRSATHCAAPFPAGQVIAVFHEMEDEPTLSRPASVQRLLGLAGGDASDAEAPSDAGPLVGAVADGGAGAVAAGAGAAGAPPKSKSPKLRGMVNVVMTSLGITSCGYAAVGLFGYLAYEYVMHGRVFKYKGRDAQTADVSARVRGRRMLLLLRPNPAPLRRRAARCIQRAPPYRLRDPPV